MKKIYYQPACLAFELGTCQVMTLSVKVNTESDAPVIDDPDDILTKGVNDLDLWGEEW